MKRLIIPASFSACGVLIILAMVLGCPPVPTSEDPAPPEGAGEAAGPVQFRQAELVVNVDANNIVMAAAVDGEVAGIRARDDFGIFLDNAKQSLWLVNVLQFGVQGIDAVPFVRLACELKAEQCQLCVGISGQPIECWYFGDGFGEDPPSNHIGSVANQSAALTHAGLEAHFFPEGIQAEAQVEGEISEIAAYDQLAFAYEFSPQRMMIGNIAGIRFGGLTLAARLICDVFAEQCQLCIALGETPLWCVNFGSGWERASCPGPVCGGV